MGATHRRPRPAGTSAIAIAATGETRYLHQGSGPSANQSHGPLPWRPGPLPRTGSTG